MAIRVIYIDDEPALCRMFRDLYSTPEICIEVYSDVTAGVAAIKAKAPDLVFLDYRLPRTTGDDIAATLDPNLPKVLISGDLSVDITSQFLKVVSKPFELDEMRCFLEEFAAGRQA